MNFWVGTRSEGGEEGGDAGEGRALRKEVVVDGFLARPFGVSDGEVGPGYEFEDTLGFGVSGGMGLKGGGRYRAAYALDLGFYVPG